MNDHSLFALLLPGLLFPEELLLVTSSNVLTSLPQTHEAPFDTLSATFFAPY